MKKRLLLSLLYLTFALTTHASEVKLDFEKIPDDKAAVLRGAELAINGCISCHSLKYIKYNDLLALGTPEATVDTWRAGNSINARIMAQMPPESAAAAFGGIVPPDLSLIAIAREGGMHYLYTYMTAYKVDEKGELVNRVYPGTRMPDILSIASATDEKQRDEIKTKAKELTAFLNWAADPRAGERKQLGIYVLIYLSILTVLLYFWKIEIWRKLG